VIRTRVGYAGGNSENPTYYRLEYHAETVQIDYDPAVISYQQLLNIVWENYDTTTPMYSTQYRSVIFYHNEEQKRLAEEWKQQWETKTGNKIYTDIIPYKAFYLAEDYHQKYYLKMQSSIYNELKRIYPDDKQLTNSTTAARINGYMGGYGTFAQLQQQIDMYGLSGAGKEKLLEIGRRRIIDTGVGDVCPVP